MNPTEIQQYSERIAAAQNADDWFALDRELRQRPDAAEPETFALLRTLERRTAPLVHDFGEQNTDRGAHSRAHPGKSPKSRATRKADLRPSS